MKKAIESQKAPAAIGPYSQAIFGQIGNLLFVSGQIPVDRKTGEFAGDDISAQTRQSILNLQAILEEGGGSLSNIVKTTVFLTSMSEFAKMNEVYADFFTEPYPARSTIEVSALPKGAKIEIEAIAII